ncbi:MAG: hypothetical protein NC827_09770 [Candidatus Omnitrophica bacterium]|nr:hypothetical protein [Candidatus Omnitrophota bacterium]
MGISEDLKERIDLKVDMNSIDPRIIILLPVAIILFALISQFLSQFQKFSCEQYCQQIATENYNKGYQEGKSKGFDEGYNQGYQKCEQIYKAKYTECLNLLNSTNSSLQKCRKELERCTLELNKTVSLDVLLNEYRVYPKNITVKQLFIYFAITIGIAFTLIEVSVKIALKRYKEIEEVLSRILLIAMVIVFIITLVDVLVKVAYFLAS